MIYPITLGVGKRLFADGTIPMALKVAESKVTPKITPFLRGILYYQRRLSKISLTLPNPPGEAQNGDERILQVMDDNGRRLTNTGEIAFLFCLLVLFLLTFRKKERNGSTRKLSFGFNEPLTIAMVVWVHHEGFLTRIPYHVRPGGHHGIIAGAEEERESVRNQSGCRAAGPGGHAGVDSRTGSRQRARG
jgi:hypothetical protein